MTKTTRIYAPPEAKLWTAICRLVGAAVRGQRWSSLEAWGLVMAVEKRPRRRPLEVENQMQHAVKVARPAPDDPVSSGCRPD